MRNDVSFEETRAFKSKPKLFYEMLFYFVSIDLGSLHLGVLFMFRAREREPLHEVLKVRIPHVAERSLLIQGKCGYLRCANTLRGAPEKRGCLKCDYKSV